MSSTAWMLLRSRKVSKPHKREGRTAFTNEDWESDHEVEGEDNCEEATVDIEKGVSGVSRQEALLLGEKWKGLFTELRSVRTQSMEVEQEVIVGIAIEEIGLACQICMKDGLRKYNRSRTIENYLGLL